MSSTSSLKGGVVLDELVGVEDPHANDGGMEDLLHALKDGLKPFLLPPN